MKRLITVFAIVGIHLCSILPLNATHIVGAELYYECISPANRQYRLTLKMYRDCLAGQAPYDDVITIFVFSSATGQAVQHINIPRPPMTPQIEPENLDACVATTPPICVEEGIYQTVIQLPDLSGGYDLAWARCCRNAAIDNLANPLGEGITFLAHVPDPRDAACNTMPQFDQTPPIFLCVDEPFFFDHSATDPDGDSLSYEITNPYTGLNTRGQGVGNPNQGGPAPVTDAFNNPMGPPPYQHVAFRNGFNFRDPFGSGNFNIDPSTGFISVVPDRAGIFVFSISVFEWRNGELLSENRRDFQIHVLNCRPQGEPPLISHDLSQVNHRNDTIFVEAMTDFCYDINVRDVNQMDVLTAYTVSAAFGQGTFIPPAATFSWAGTNPIQGQICWQPSCAYDGQVVPLIIGAKDIGDCPNISDVFDTVYVSIEAPPNLPPVIQPDYSGLTFDQDTIVVSAMSNFCYSFDITDANSGDRINSYTVSEVFDGPNPPTFTVSGTNPVRGEICWTPDCDLEGEVVELTFAAADLGGCAISGPVESTVFVRIEVPPNDPPLILTDLSGNTVVEDTIIVDAMSAFCYNFTVQDPNAGDQLQVVGVSPLFSDPNGPQLSLSNPGSNPVQGQICWEPGCEYENQLIPLVVAGEDAGLCNASRRVQDTVYVRINVPPNDPPEIVNNFGNLLTRNDTIFVTANEGLCYTFTVTDPNLQDELQAINIGEVFNGPNPPSFSVTGTNPLTGEICWTPDCDFANQVVPLSVAANDNGMCSSQRDVLSTVYISVSAPPNDPPTVTHNLSGLDARNDTVFVFAEEQLCYDVVFNDANAFDTLTVEPLSPVFANGQATFTPLGTNPIQGQVCWTPTCEVEGQVVPLLLKARDNGECNNFLEVVDTVYVSIRVPQTAPPIVGSDLSGTNHNGDTIRIFIGEGLCYDFFVADRTPNTSLDYTFEFQDFGGTDIGLGTVDVQRRNDSIVGQVCFQSDCSNGGSLYRLIITGIDARTCPPFEQSKDTVFIKVDTDFGSDVGPDISFCEGSGGIQLNVNAIGGTGPYYYNWGCTDDPNCGFSNPNAKNPVVNPTGSTTFYVQITDKFGCTSEFDSIRVGVDALPRVNVGPDVSICEAGGSVQLEAVIENSEEAPGPYTFEWLPADGLSDPNIPNPVAAPTTTTIYTVVVRGANGCSSSTTNLDTASTVVVNVSERPRAEAGDERIICVGDSVQLAGFASGAGPDYTYEWSPAASLDNPTSQRPLAFPTQTTTYYLTATSNGCSGTPDSVRVVVKALPEVNPGTDFEICAVEEVVLNGQASGDPGERYTYRWTPATGLSDPFSPTPTASPDTTTTYLLVATSNFGCKNEPYPVRIEVLPTPKAEAGDHLFICREDSVELRGSHTFFGGLLPPGEPVYNWSPATGLSNPGIPNPKASPAETQLYTLTVTYGRCSTSDQVKLDVFNTIETSVSVDKGEICSGDVVQLSASGGSGGALFNWFPADHLDNPSSPNPVASPAETTTYYVQIEEGGCRALDSIQVVVNPTPVAQFSSSGGLACAPMEIMFTELTQNALSYSWNFGDGSPLSTEPNPVHVFETPGTYQVVLTATGEGGCTASSQPFEVQVFPKGVAAFSSTPPVNSSQVLPRAAVDFLNESVNATGYVWDFGDGETSEEANPRHVYHQPGSYTVTLIITDEGGCRDTLALGTYNIFAPDLFIPNVFSPNQDGINDHFLVRYTGKEPFRMEVFDRWGKQMFEENGNPANGWDGQAPSGNPAGEGVYFYMIKIGEKAYTGNVTLVR